jgi:pimeloyl-ACP methyl ester carboxylesterase
LALNAIYFNGCGGSGVQTIIKYLSGGFFLYIMYCLLIFMMQRMMLFPRGLISTPPEQTPKIAGFEKIWLNTSHGKVESWFIPPAQNKNIPAPVVIFAHGNGELIGFWPDELKPFSAMGIGLLLVEYPGYGRSQGRPTQKTITEAFVKAYDRVVKRGDVDGSRIILLGRSVGGGAVCALAGQRPSASLILMSTFMSVRSFASKYRVPKFLVRDPFNNLAIVRSYKEPLLIIHGRNDEVIPYRHGIALHKASNGGRMITYSAGHNDCPPDWNLFWTDIESFLKGAKILSPD